jgi:hypothetical protein
MAVINPTRLKFQASAQHGQAQEDGTPFVVGYRIETVGAGPVELGLPVPDAQGVIDVALPVAAGGPYLSRVVAYNDAGVAAGPSTEPYGFTRPT